VFRNGYELLTGLTNILILIVSLYSFIRLKRLNYNKYWLSFYMFLIVGSLFGFIIHSFNINDKIVNILWIILLFIFICIINSLLFSEYKYNKYIVFISILFYIFLVVEAILNMNFIITFIIYVCMNFIFIVKSYIKNKRYYYLYGIIIQIIGGLLLISRNIKIWYLDHNGIYHIFMMITIILFYISNKKYISEY